MMRATSMLTFLAVIAATGTAKGQVFSGGDPVGYSLVTLTHVNPALPVPTGLVWNGDLLACTSGPDFMLIAGYRHDGIWAVGRSGLDNHAYEVPIITMTELAQDSFFDEDDAIVGMAATPALDAVYVGFQPYYQFNSCLPVIRVALDGSWEVAFSCEELTAFAAGKVRVRNLATAPDGTLYAIVQYQDEGHMAVLRIDPDGVPGERAELVLSTDQLVSLMPGIEPGYIPLLQIAADDHGRFFVLAMVSLPKAEGLVESAHVLLRVDPDGTLTEMTERETNSSYTGVDTERMYPARSCLEGILYDVEDGFLVCGGNGNVFLIDPERSRRNHLLVPGFVVRNTYSVWSGEPVFAAPGGVGGLGGCLGDISWGEHRAYGAVFGTFMAFSWDSTLLDLDGDLLLGFEEELWGTDPFDPDSDRGGTYDGLEFIDFTDPLQAEDDRVGGEAALRWGSSGLWFGSRAGNSTSSRHALERFGVAAPDGSLLLVRAGSGKELVRFTGWDEPLVSTGQQGSVMAPMAAAPDGSVYRYQEGWGVVRAGLDGTDEAALEDGEIRDLTAADSVQVTGIAVQPDGTLVVGTRDGHLIAADVEGGVTLLYDAFADYEAAGYWTEEDGCFGGFLCELPIGPITYEPVHGVLFFWIKTELLSTSDFQLALVAIRPDGHMKIVADHWVFAEAMSLLGGMDPLDMEPDMAGGLWVLGSGKGQRRLLHLDGNLEVVTGMTAARPMSPPVTTAGGLPLSHAWDLMVTPDGRLFAADGYYNGMSPASFGLVEILPVDDVVRGGDLLVVQAEAATLSKLTPEGGGILLHQGAPLEQPVAVAAAGGLVAVGDAALGEILVSELDEDGRLGPWKTVAAVGMPTGLDIDGEGRILVVDGIGRRLLRVALDGTTEVLAEGDVLGEPFDVVATASGAAAVTDINGRLVRVAADGVVTILAELTAPGAAALVAGRHYAVSSVSDALWPVTVGPGAVTGPTGTADESWVLESEEVPGGIAAAPDGTLFQAMVKGFNWDWKDPFPTLRVFRITADGLVHPLVRYGVEVGAGPGDLCRVRGQGEPLPAEPGDAPLPMPADEDVGEGGAAKSGCGMTSSPGAARLPALFALLLVVVALLLLRTRPRRAMAVMALVLVVAACGGGRGGGGVDPDAWDSGPIPSTCQGKDLCQPASAPVCVDGAAASKRCVPDDDGCWVWSALVPCPAEAPCEEGICGGPWCAPACESWMECGDDGCGGQCGACEAPEVCCGGICAICEVDCAARECGWDGATGICGECAEGMVCVDGTCTPPGKAFCGEYLNECDLLCEPWDAFCADQCEAWLSKVGKYDVLAFEGCQLLMCAPCFEEGGDQACLNACVFQHCAEESATCFNREGTATCAETWACTEACASDDQPCIDGCTAEATREAMIVLIGIVTCVEAICQPDLPDAERDACEDAALLNECAAQAEPCFGPCEPTCPTWAVCGPDGCTGVCGVCPDGQFCNSFECHPI